MDKIFKKIRITLIFSLTFSFIVAINAFVFSLTIPPVFGQTANAWNLQRTGAGNDLNMFYSTGGTTALQLNTNGDARARKILDLDDQNFYLDPQATTNLNRLTLSQIPRVSGTAQLNVGDLISETGATKAGWRVIPYSDNNVYQDTKVGTNGILQYRIGANTESGATRTWMSVNGSNGYVGIGTGGVLPAGLLQVGRYDGTVDTKGGILLASGTGSGGARRYWVGAAANPDTHNNNNFAVTDYDGSTNLNLMTIYGAHNGSSAGYVGIGTTSPGTRLQVGNTGGMGAASEGVIRSATNNNAGGSRYWDFGVGQSTFGNYGFNIRDSAQTSVPALNIAYQSQRVGLRTGSPIADLHIKQSSESQFEGGIVLESSGSTNKAAIILGGTQLYLFPGEQSRTTGFGVIDTNGNYQRVAWSSKDLKENVQPVDFQDVLNKIDQLPINTWNYKDHINPTRHMGPFAEDFYDLFQLDNSRTTINGSDQAGVTMAGVKALSSKLKEQDKKIEQLQQEIEELKKLIKQP